MVEEQRTIAKIEEGVGNAQVVVPEIVKLLLKKLWDIMPQCKPEIWWKMIEVPGGRSKVNIWVIYSHQEGNTPLE